MGWFIGEQQRSQSYFTFYSIHFENLMNNPVYDVIVVGAGNAALCAALSAQEHGAKVLVLESAPQEQRGGNSAYTGGGFRIVYHGVEDIKKFVPDVTPEEIANTDFSEYT